MTETLGPYELVRLLGRGGMGEVHLARDTRLDRLVALKLLPDELAEDEGRRARFLREARAAATLNHPNVTTIHEVGEVDGRDYIAQEYVEGRPLNELLAERSLPLLELAQLAVPLADALEYAHECGVIHRDLKPANVIVTERGHAKLLDFGLAKLLQPDDEPTAHDEPSTTLTISGAVFGTPSAMSPEQALGKAVDARSDVFSFGALLYELASGKPAFLGTTVQETLDKVLHAEPEPLERLRRDLPSDFVAIVHKALRKDPDARYQSMADLTADLRHFKSATDSGLVPPASSGTSAGAGGWGRLVLPAALAVIALLAWRLLAESEASQRLPRLVNPRQLTAAVGLEDAPNWAGEGSLVAYMAAPPGGDYDVFIMQEGSGSPVNRTADLDGDAWHPSLSPDGRTIAFWHSRKFDQVNDRTEAGSLYTMPALGGAARLLLPGVVGYGPPQWSADGERLAFLQRLDDGSTVVRIVRTSGETVRELPLPGLPLQHLADLSWSPDERHFALVVTADPHAASVNQLFLVDADTGQSTALTEAHSLTRSPCWTPDGRALLYVCNQGGTMDLWRQLVDDDGRPDGEPAVLTAGLGMSRCALSSDGRRLVYGRGGVVANLWRLPLQAEGPATWEQARQITFDEALIEQADLSHDGSTLVLSSNRAGNPDLWLLPAEGGPMTQLTDDPAPDWFPRFSPDDQQLLFYAYRSDNRDLWVMPAGGGPARQLTTDPGTDWFGDWSPDGRHILWSSLRDGTMQMYWAALDDLVPQLVPAGQGRAGSFSSNVGVWVDAESLLVQRDGRVLQMGRDGSTLRTIEDMKLQANAMVMVPGVEAMLYNGREQIWRLDLESQERRPVTALAGRPGSLGPVTGCDGEQLWFLWRELRGDLWVMDIEDGE